MRFHTRPLMPLVTAAAWAATLLAGGAQAAVTSPTEADRAELEKQLQEARSELDAAAREVADLSRQLYGEGGEAIKLMHGGSRGSMLGINLGGGNSPDEGVAVAGVSPGGPAEQAGLKAGDLVVAVDGKALKRRDDRSAISQLVQIMRDTPPGTSMKVEYLRDGKRQTATITTAAAEPPVVKVIRERLAGLPEGALPVAGLERLFGPERGFGSLELVPLTPKLGRYFGTDRGLLVVRAPESKQLPLEEGDVLQSIDGRTPDNPGHAFRILRSYEPGEKVKLGVMRERKALTLEATMPSAAAEQQGHRHMRLPSSPAAAPSSDGSGPA